jgi:hypothetical protein
MAMIRTISTHVAAVGTVVLTVVLAGVFDNLQTTSPIKLIVVGFLLVAVLVLAVWDIVVARKRAPIRYSGADKDEKARAFMTKLITENNGRCAISSNNLSWVTGDALVAMTDKASNKSLLIVMPQENETSKELALKGAEVYYYGAELSPISSRFTIVNFGRSGKWAAVSHEVDGAHIIQKVRSGSDPTLHMAEDLFEMARRKAVGERALVGKH